VAVCVFEGGHLEDVGCLREGFAESGRKEVSEFGGGRGSSEREGKVR